MDTPLDNGQKQDDHGKAEDAPQASVKQSEAKESAPERSLSFSVAEQHLIDVQAAAYVKAQQIIENNRIAREERLAAEALANQPEPIVMTPYHQRYFITRAIKLIFAPSLVFVLLVILMVLIQNALAEAGSNQLSKALFVEVSLVLICGLWVARQTALAFLCSLYVDEKVFDMNEPRIAWLGLLGPRTAFKVAEMSITNYYESFWNFIPGWNSWVLEIDTGLQNDGKIQILKHVKDGDYVVKLVSPHIAQTKKSLFSRR